MESKKFEKLKRTLQLNQLTVLQRSELQRLIGDQMKINAITLSEEEQRFILMMFSEKKPVAG
ncbi:hypothetical protein AB4562_28010 [Vibrio sp. 10N.222.54.A1]|uniref:Uncharacterized protein n=3 Tax=Vibrio TaxID=662 RepID=A0A7Z1S2T9_9VIBR|nr:MULTISPECIES: hypothetical protein [Vibrio]MCF7497069.1 hypothetical protein [Vibrio sp. L5-1]MCW8345507.1 hypothetical protein [Vibrio qingdaonensis]PMK78422.1 hypothetical protein BCT92_20490 [Vibrio sp. 10N.261.52.E5]PMP25107.1 hypothetical protein BCS91_12695 [Vibrio cyclitrophicus]PMP29942.1 hypothetical protein BCS90_00580 [Vibrio cyclitrophicus]